ncbi:putative CRISPR-associated protein [Limisphaera sp. VF-2]|uniref:putative CRISPR-associated protein n=1 Tax=Limisphaera sp. VF-2 TaxID=3400418 RepID=UPI00176370EC
MEHHILTVGVSLLQNFARSKSPPVDFEFALKHHPEVWTFLLENPTAASAEINSLEMRTRFLSSPSPPSLSVTLIHTETPLGKCTCSLLERFLKKCKVRVDKIPVKGFDKPAGDADPEFAQREALEALTQMRERVIRHIIRLKEQSPDLSIHLNATGGYKAEVAVLYELGRFLRLPVYYLHETFRTCVTLP